MNGWMTGVAIMLLTRAIHGLLYVIIQKYLQPGLCRMTHVVSSLSPQSTLLHFPPSLTLPLPASPQLPPTAAPAAATVVHNLHPAAFERPRLSSVVGSQGRDVC